MRTPIKTILLALACLLIFQPAYADHQDPPPKNAPYSFTKDGFYFNIIQNTTNVYVNGIYSFPEDLVVPSTVTYEGIEYTVTKLEGHGLSIPRSGLDNYGEYKTNHTTKTVTLPETLTEIGGLGFSGMAELTKINFPENLVSIDYTYSGMGIAYGYGSIFDCCDSLNEITLPVSLNKLGVAVFRNCSIDTINILSPITIIGSEAFKNCKVKDLNFSDISKIKTIANGAFNGCNSDFLKHFDFPSSLKTIGDEAFRATPIQKVVLPDGITTIGRGAFAYCQELSSAIIGEGPKVFSCTFMHCPNLSEVKLPESTEELQFTFFNCPKIREFNLSEKITKIGISPFGMTHISSLKIPSSVQEIASDAFAYCGDLFSITFLDSPKELVFFTDDDNKRYIQENLDIVPSWQLPNGNKVAEMYIGRSLKNKSFTDYRYKLKDITFGPMVKYICGSLLENVSLVKSISIPDNVETIGEYAFKGCTGLTELHLGSSLQTIGKSAFEADTNLSKVSIPNKVETIGKYAFKDCSGLTSLYLGSALREIGDNAFENNLNITTIETANPTPPEIFSETFLRVNKYSCEVYVPVGSAERYRYTDYWNDFRTFKEKDFSGVSDTVADGTAVRLEGGRLVLTGADTRVTVYAADGRLVADRRLSSGESLELPSRSLYIVNAAGRSFKICY